MALFCEKVVLEHGVLEVEISDDLTYALRCGEVHYQNDRRRVRGRAARYDFRSVEQLRYDFERELEAVGGGLG
jgi:hypothetical protein